MTESKDGKENEENKAEETSEDRLAEIKREETEDASSYYAQGDSEEENLEAEYDKPLPSVNKEAEDLSMFKAIAFLGFGLLGIGILFVLFFIRDLDDRLVKADSKVNEVDASVKTFGASVTAVEDSVKGMGTKVDEVGATVSELNDKFDPLRKEIDDKFDTVNTTVDKLKSKVGNYERSMAIMELKRALVTVTDLSMGDSAEVKAKSGNIAKSIEALLNEFGVTSGSSTGTIEVREDDSDLDTSHAKSPVSAEEHTSEAVEEEHSSGGDKAEAEAEDGEDGEDGEEDGDGEAEDGEAPAEEHASDDAHASEAPAEEHASEDAHASEAPAEEHASDDAHASEAPAEEHASEDAHASEDSAEESAGEDDEEDDEDEKEDEDL